MRAWAPGLAPRAPDRRSSPPRRPHSQRVACLRVSEIYTLTGLSNGCVTGVTHALLAIELSGLAAPEEREHLAHLRDAQEGQRDPVRDRASSKSNTKRNDLAAKPAPERLIQCIPGEV